MRQNYLDRAMKARDPRFAKIAGKLGYGTRQMAAAPRDDIDALRAEYEKIVGKRPFNGWKADTLRQKITDAKAKG